MVVLVRTSDEVPGDAMTMLKAMKDAMLAYQEELKKLPCAKPRNQEEYDDWYDGKVVLEKCNGTQAQQHYGKQYGCRTCSITFHKDEVPDLTLPPHARMLHSTEQAELAYDLVVGVLGLDRWNNDDVLSGGSAVRDARQANTQSGRLAAGLPFLTAALIKQEASIGVKKVVDELLSFSPGMSLHDDMDPDWPLFSEGVLYELLGKDTARSVLARTRALAAVTGYRGEVG